MNDPVEDPTSNATYLLVTWTGISSYTDTGGDPINFYKLEWD